MGALVLLNSTPSYVDRLVSTFELEGVRLQ
jgi:hypothetical protein